MTVKVSSVTAVAEPREQVVNMLGGGEEESFLDSLPDNTSSDFNLEEPQPSGRKKRSDAGKPKGPRGKKAPAIEGEVIDERLERAKKKFASLGGGTAIKSVFVMLEKPLEKSEEEDVDDYFYLLSEKASLDPSESWAIMFGCALLLLLRLLGTRTAIGGEIKKLFDGKKEEPVSDEQLG